MRQPSRDPGSLRSSVLWRYRHIVGAAILTFIIVGGMIGAANIIVQLRHEAAGTLTRTTVTNIAIALGESVGGLTTSIDVVLGLLSRDYAADSGHFAEEVASVVEALGTGLVLQVSVADHDGTLVYSSAGRGVGSIGIADRDHFKVHLDPARDELYISRPVVGRVSGTPSIQFSRKIVRHGRFAGVVVLSVSPDYFVRLFAKLDLGTEGAVNLIRDDGAVLARATNVAPTRVLSEATLRDRPFLGPGAQVSGVYDAESMVDGLRRTGGFRRVDGYPLIVTALVSRREIEADLARRDQPIWGAVAVIGFVTALALLGGGMLASRVERRLNIALDMREAMLVEAAATDPLTGLPNRLAFNRRLAEEFERARVNRSTFAIVAIDLDHFKSINDGFGHKSGDDALIAVGTTLSREVRGTDLCARLGGEELAVLLPGISLAAACGLAERVRAAIAQLTIDGSDGRAIKLTASFGVAILNHQDSTPEQVLDRADRALYRAKHAGRDRVLADMAEA